MTLHIKDTYVGERMQKILTVFSLWMKNGDLKVKTIHWKIILLQYYFLLNSEKMIPPLRAVFYSMRLCFIPIKGGDFFFWGENVRFHENKVYVLHKTIVFKYEGCLKTLKVLHSKILKFLKIYIFSFKNNISKYYGIFQHIRRLGGMTTPFTVKI